MRLNTLSWYLLLEKLLSSAGIQGNEMYLVSKVAFFFPHQAHTLLQHGVVCLFL